MKINRIIILKKNLNEIIRTFTVFRSIAILIFIFQVKSFNLLNTKKVQNTYLGAVESIRLLNVSQLSITITNID